MPKDEPAPRRGMEVVRALARRALRRMLPRVKINSRTRFLFGDDVDLDFNADPIYGGLDVSEMDADNVVVLL